MPAHSSPSVNEFAKEMADSTERSQRCQVKQPGFTGLIQEIITG